MFDLYTSENLSFIKDFQLENFWILNFDDLPGFDFYVKSSNLPMFSIDLTKTGFDLIYLDRKSENDSFTIEFYETQDFMISNYFLDWINSIYDFKNRIFKIGALTAKRNALISFVTYKHPGVIQYNKQFNLKGIMLQSIGSIDLSNDSGEPLTVTMTMEVQRIEPIS